MSGGEGSAENRPDGPARRQEASNPTLAESSRDRHGLFITGSHLQTPHSNQIACTGPRSTCISGDTLHQDMGPCELISVPC